MHYPTSAFLSGVGSHAQGAGYSHSFLGRAGLLASLTLEVAGGARPALACLSSFE